jgi:hypothetical protein
LGGRTQRKEIQPRQDLQMKSNTNETRITPWRSMAFITIFSMPVLSHLHEYE